MKQLKKKNQNSANNKEHKKNNTDKQYIFNRFYRSNFLQELRTVLAPKITA